MATSGDIRQAKAKAVGGKRDRCQKGKSCSAACIFRLKECLVELPDMVSSAAGKFRDKLRSSVGGIRDRVDASSALREYRRETKKDRVDSIRERVRDKMVKAAKDGDKSAYKRWEKVHVKVMWPDTVVRDKIWKQEVTKDFMDRVKKTLENDKVFVSKGWGEVIIDKRVGGQDLTLKLMSNGRSFAFLVNGSDLADPTIPKRDKVAIIKETRRLFEKVVGQMREGSEVFVAAREGDASTEVRMKAYPDFGFKRDGDKNAFYGRVKDGKIEGSSPRRYERYSQGDNFNFY